MCEKEIVIMAMIMFNKKFDKFLKKNNIGYSINLRDTVSVMFCFHELDDETLEIKMLDIVFLCHKGGGLKHLETFLLEYMEEQKELYKKETVKMATVVRCDICERIHDDRDYNFENIIRCNINNDIELDICQECFDKIKVFCSDINANYKKILDNIPANDGKKA